jgi:hypothetical protein
MWPMPIVAMQPVGANLQTLPILRGDNAQPTYELSALDQAASAGHSHPVLDRQNCAQSSREFAEAS